MNYLWDNIFRRSISGDEVLQTMKNNFLFQDLSDRDLRFLKSIVHVRKYHAGEAVFKQGEVGVGMYIIVKGRVEIFVTDPSIKDEAQRDIFITQLSNGDFFGELALVEDNGRRTASATAHEETTLIGFFKPDLNEILSRQPGVGIKVLFRLAEVLGRRLKETTEKVSDLRRALRELREPPSLEDPNGSTTSSRAST